jgi:hypothetical protein
VELHLWRSRLLFGWCSSLVRFRGAGRTLEERLGIGKCLRGEAVQASPPLCERRREGRRDGRRRLPPCVVLRRRRARASTRWLVRHFTDESLSYCAHDAPIELKAS